MERGSNQVKKSREINADPMTGMRKVWSHIVIYLISIIYFVAEKTQNAPNFFLRILRIDIRYKTNLNFFKQSKVLFFGD